MKTVKVTELQKQMGVVGIFALVLICLGVWVWIVPSVQKITRLQFELSLVGKKQDLLKQIEISNGRLKALEAGLLQDKERNLVLSHVTTLAKKSGLEVDSVSPNLTDKATEGTYRNFGVRAKAFGAFQSLLGLMGQIDQKVPKLAITSIELNRSSDNGKDNSGQSKQESSPAISVSFDAQTVLVNS